MLNSECAHCRAASSCPTACEYGSIMCMAKRLQTGQTKADLIKAQQPKYCAFCGHPLKTIGSETFCNNVRCINRYQKV